MTKVELGKWMDVVFGECRGLREAGQKEYARREDNAFANFERVGERLQLTREQILLVYLEKHLDGINAWVSGHKSQREDVRGRINDAITYLCLLRGMVEESETPFIPQDDSYKFQADGDGRGGAQFQPKYPRTVSGFPNCNCAEGTEIYCDCTSARLGG